jgi:hypothetical protein
MRFLLLIGMFFLSVSVKSQQSQERLLHEAYKTKSSKKLKLFIDRWATVSSLSVANWATTKNDTIKAFNEVYRQFYLSENQGLTKTDVVTGSIYVVLDDDPVMAITDTLPMGDSTEGYPNEPNYELLQSLTYREGNREQMFQSYVPVLGIPKLIILSLNSKYNSYIKKFLDSKPPGKKQNDDGYLGEDRVGHDEEKVAFLSAYLPMVKRHWGHYWNYLSYPNIKQIVFNKELTSAVVSYKLSSKGGMACYKKTETGWTFIDKRILTIQ